MSKEKKGLLLKGISKIYLDPKSKKEFYAVKDVNIEIKPGEFVTLLGPSGCGKTTTLRMIAGFESPDEGDIIIGNESVNALTPDKRDTALVFQSYALFPHYNVFENISYGLKLRKVPKDEIKRRVSEMLSLVELAGMEERMTNQLSGGQQQRVALARALVVQPGVLLFDEPLSNLDANLRVSMRAEIRRIQSQLGITAVYVTHDQSEAMAISDRIVVMNKGSLVQAGSPDEIYQRPTDEFVADFIGEVNFFNAKAVRFSENGTIFSSYGAMMDLSGYRFAAGTSVKILLRPESIHLAVSGVFRGKVILSVFMGNHQLYHIRMSDGNLVKVTEYNPKGKKIYRLGDEVGLTFDNSDIHIITI